MNHNKPYQSLQDIVLIHQGKVRDVYRLDEQHLLMIASDRLSAFDVVLPQPIPGKGELLTQISNFWFDKTQHIIQNHLSDKPLQTFLSDELAAQLQRRAVVVKALQPLPVEAIVRGYLIGSGWKDYQASGSLCGIQLPHGLQQAARLPEAIFTPSSKAAIGDHDQNISFERMGELIGDEMARQVREVSLQLYRFAAEHASNNGLILADTKFEFGLDNNRQLILMDEIFTPDSSRFWTAEDYRPGSSPASLDKQFVRDYLETLDWDKTPPGPDIPTHIIDATRQRYALAYTKITGKQWAE